LERSKEFITQKLLLSYKKPIKILFT